MVLSHRRRLPSYGVLAPSAARPLVVFQYHHPPTPLWFSRTIGQTPCHGSLAPSPARPVLVFLHHQLSAHLWCSHTHPAMVFSHSRPHSPVVFQHLARYSRTIGPTCLRYSSTTIAAPLTCGFITTASPFGRSFLTPTYPPSHTFLTLSHHSFNDARCCPPHHYSMLIERPHPSHFCVLGRFRSTAVLSFFPFIKRDLISPQSLSD